MFYDAHRDQGLDLHLADRCDLRRVCHIGWYCACGGVWLGSYTAYRRRDCWRRVRVTGVGNHRPTRKSSLRISCAVRKGKLRRRSISQRYQAPARSRLLLTTSSLQVFLESSVLTDQSMLSSTRAAENIWCSCLNTPWQICIHTKTPDISRLRGVLRSIASSLQILYKVVHLFYLSCFLPRSFASLCESRAF